MKPYKVVAYEPGAAHIVDRATGEYIGVVVANYHSDWEGYLTDSESGRVAFRKYRADCAAEVWAAR